MFRKMWLYREVNFHKVFAAFFWLWSSAVSAFCLCQQNETYELQDLRCLTAHVPFLRLLPQKQIPLRSRKTGKANLQFQVLFPVPLEPWQTLQLALQQHFKSIPKSGWHLKLLNHGRFSVWFLVALYRDAVKYTGKWAFKCFELWNRLDIGLKISLSQYL